MIVLLGLDVVTKWLSANHLPPLLPIGYPFGGIPLFEMSGITASLNQVRNGGAAWGVLQGFPALLAIARIVCAGILFFSKNRTLAFLLIATGALGNGIDFWIYGKVIDFIYLTFWGYSFPVFNLADCCITIGALLLLFSPKNAPVKASHS